MAAAHPDAALYRQAQQALASLRASPRRQSRRGEWEKAILQFRRLVARYPQSGYCDNALLAVGDLYREMAQRFKAARYEDDADQAYRQIVSEYPSSRLGESALFSIFEIARSRGDRRPIADAATAYLDAYPAGARAERVRAALPTKPRTTVTTLAASTAGLAQVYNLRFWSGDSSTRVVLDVERRVPIRYDRIRDPDRLWIDLDDARLHPNLMHRSFPVGDGLLEQIRLGQNKEGVVRVVLDFKDVKDHSVFYLDNPIRLVIDVRGSARAPMAFATPPPVSPASPAPVPLETASASEAVGLPPHSLNGLHSPDMPATAQKGQGRPPIVLEGAPPPTAAPPSAPQRARLEPSPPVPPQLNRAGSYSLARQLGLGVRRIVIDAGHGGHDPGSIGHDGLQEKDLVLDVARRLETLVRDELGAEVLMTRSSDVFIPLEERTAIANSRGADLFLSIHANSSRNPRARGIETYFLNFATDPHAEAVAARENSISAATLKDLQGLVKAIALNSKIDESRDFAACVHESMVQALKVSYGDVLDRGVHTAPFYVLIGANMPSVLAEIAFISHPQDEQLLKTPEHREQIAHSLLEGVRSYLDALNRTQTRQLTGPAQGSTVASSSRPSRR